MEATTPRPGRLARLAAAAPFILGLALLISAAVFLGRTLPARMYRSDFSHIYPSARILAAGGNVYATPLPAYWRHAGLPFQESMERETNPPLLVWALRPLAWLPLETAFWIWVTIQLFCLTTMLALARSQLRARLSTAAWCLAAGLALFSFPMLAHLWSSQVQLLLGALIMLGFVLAQRGRWVSAAALLTLAGALKLFPLAMVPWLVLRAPRPARVRVALVSLAWLVFWLALPGWSMWQSYRTHAAPYLATYLRPDVDNYSWFGFFAGLGALPYDMSPPAEVTQGMHVLAGLAAALMLGHAAWRTHRNAAADAVLEGERPREPLPTVRPLASSHRTGADSFNLVLIASVVCSPLAWSHYLVLLIYPLLCLAADVRHTSGAGRWWRAGLLVLAVVSFNLTSSDWLPTAIGVGGYLLRREPFLVMLALYAYFAMRPSRGSQGG